MPDGALRPCLPASGLRIPSLAGYLIATPWGVWECAQVPDLMNDRILIIDDDPTVHELLGAYLTRGGYIVHSAQEGRDGIAMSATANVALLIVDLVLPETSPGPSCWRRSGAAPTCRS